MVKNKREKTYGWIWYMDDINKEPPVIRLMNEEDRPKRIKFNGGKTWKHYHFMI